jgi:pyrroline-5-carboxylate reductase
MRSLVGMGPSLFRAVVPWGNPPYEGAVAMAAEPGADAHAIEWTRALLGWIGPVEVVAEEALDALYGVVAGGPLFFGAALEGLEQGAISEGLPRHTAHSFTLQTALATALLLRDHRGSPADLKDQVASPGGTTIAALAVLEDAGVRGAFLRAVQLSVAEMRVRRDAGPAGMIE